MNVGCNDQPIFNYLDKQVLTTRSRVSLYFRRGRLEKQFSRQYVDLLRAISGMRFESIE